MPHKCRDGLPGRRIAIATPLCWPSISRQRAASLPTRRAGRTDVLALRIRNTLREYAARSAIPALQQSSKPPPPAIKPCGHRGYRAGPPLGDAAARRGPHLDLSPVVQALLAHPDLRRGFNARHHHEISRDLLPGRYARCAPVSLSYICAIVVLYCHPAVARCLRPCAAHCKWLPAMLAEDNRSLPVPRQTGGGNKPCRSNKPACASAGAARQRAYKNASPGH